MQPWVRGGGPVVLRLRFGALERWWWWSARSCYRDHYSVPRATVTKTATCTLAEGCTVREFPRSRLADRTGEKVWNVKLAPRQPVST